MSGIYDKGESIKTGNSVLKSSSKMKVFIVILCLALTAFADHHEGHDDHHDYTIKTHDDLVRYREECGRKLNVPADKMEKYKTWNYDDDEITRCYMKCIFEHFGFFDDTHGFNVHQIHHQLVGTHGDVDHNDELHHKIDTCADKNTAGSDACTWAYRGGMCFLRNNLQLVKESVLSH